jgi:hypothetical protein
VVCVVGVLNYLNPNPWDIGKSFRVICHCVIDRVTLSPLDWRRHGRWELGFRFGLERWRRDGSIGLIGVVVAEPSDLC